MLVMNEQIENISRKLKSKREPNENSKNKKYSI